MFSQKCRMSYHHIEKHTARPLVLRFENSFHHCKEHRICFQKTYIWHITTRFVAEGHNSGQVLERHSIHKEKKFVYSSLYRRVHVYISPWIDTLKRPVDYLLYSTRLWKPQPLKEVRTSIVEPIPHQHFDDSRFERHDPAGCPPAGRESHPFVSCSYCTTVPPTSTSEGKSWPSDTHTVVWE